MKKEIFTHFSFLFTFLVLTLLIKRWFDLIYLQFLLGGILGTILPDLDHLLYVYYFRPGEDVSHKVRSVFSKNQVITALNLLAETRKQRTELVFHSATFQIIFLILSFLVITSSGSIFGRGLVLAFMLHLLVDQLIDFIETDSLTSWFKNIPVRLDRTKAALFWVANLLIFLIFAFLM